MIDLKLKDITDSKMFQRLCEELLAVEYPDFQTVNDTMGDEGCDGRARGGKLKFQVYYPDKTGTLPHRMHKLRDKIRNDTNKLYPPYPEEWVLITHEDPTPKLLHYVERREKKFPGMRILIWSESKLSALLNTHEGIKSAWMKKVYGGKHEVIPPEAVVYSKRNDLLALLRQGKENADSLRNWEFSKYYEQIHLQTSTGRAAVQLKPLHPNAFTECPVQFRVGLKFGEPAEGKKNFEEFKDSIRSGREYRIDGKNIHSLALEIGGKKFDWMDPEGKPTDVVVRPLPMEPIQVSIELIDKEFIRSDRLEKLNLRASWPNSVELQFDNFDDKPAALKFKLLVNTSTGESSCSFRPPESIMDALDGFRFMEHLIAVEQSPGIRLRFLNVGKSMHLQKTAAGLSDETKEIFEISRLLKEIQDRIDQDLPSIIGRDLQRWEVGWIRDVHCIVTTGRYCRKIESLEGTFERLTPEGARILSSGKELSIKLVSKDCHAELLGIDIPFGDMTSYFSGKLSEELLPTIQEAGIGGSAVTIRLVCAARDKGYNTEDFFHKWLHNPEEVMAKFEADNTVKD